MGTTPPKDEDEAFDAADLEGDDDSDLAALTIKREAGAAAGAPVLTAEEALARLQAALGGDLAPATSSALASASASSSSSSSSSKYVPTCLRRM